MLTDLRLLEVEGIPGVKKSGGGELAVVRRKAAAVSEPVRDLALLLVGLDEDPRVADEVRVALGKDEPNRLRVEEGDEAEHAFRLVRDAHVLYRPVHAVGPTDQSPLEQNTELKYGYQWRRART